MVQQNLFTWIILCLHVSTEIPQVFVLATFILHECRCLIVTLCLYPGIIDVFDVGNFSCFDCLIVFLGQGLCLFSSGHTTF